MNYQLHISRQPAHHLLHLVDSKIIFLFTKTFFEDILPIIPTKYHKSFCLLIQQIIQKTFSAKFHPATTPILAQ